MADFADMKLYELQDENGEDIVDFWDQHLLRMPKRYIRDVTGSFQVRLIPCTW